MDCAHQWVITRNYLKRGVGTCWTVRCRRKGCQAYMKLTERGRRFRTTPPQVADALLLFTAPDLRTSAA